MTTTWETTTVRHGTHSGWFRHTSLGERPCDPCYAAKQKYDADRKAAPYQTVLNRLHAKAQQQASAQLRRIYPDVYAVLYAQAKARLLVERADELDAARDAS